MAGNASERGERDDAQRDEQRTTRRATHRAARARSGRGTPCICGIGHGITSHLLHTTNVRSGGRASTRTSEPTEAPPAVVGASSTSQRVCRARRPREPRPSGAPGGSMAGLPAKLPSPPAAALAAALALPLALLLAPPGAPPSPPTPPPGSPALPPAPSPAAAMAAVAGACTAECGECGEAGEALRRPRGASTARRRDSCNALSCFVYCSTYCGNGMPCAACERRSHGAALTDAMSGAKERRGGATCTHACCTRRMRGSHVGGGGAAGAAMDGAAGGAVGAATVGTAGGAVAGRAPPTQ